MDIMKQSEDASPDSLLLFYITHLDECVFHPVDEIRAFYLTL